MSMNSDERVYRQAQEPTAGTRDLRGRLQPRDLQKACGRAIGSAASSQNGESSCPVSVVSHTRPDTSTPWLERYEVFFPAKSPTSDVPARIASHHSASGSEERRRTRDRGIAMI